ncbi:MAG TPA: phosphotransferase [Rhizomicrobium sp.]
MSLQRETIPRGRAGRRRDGRNAARQPDAKPGPQHAIASPVRPDHNGHAGNADQTGAMTDAPRHAADPDRQLRANDSLTPARMSFEGSTPEMAIGALLRKTLGIDVRHIGCEPILRSKSGRRKRSFSIHTFETIGTAKGALTVFSKNGLVHDLDYTLRLERFLSALRLEEFRAPRFYGIVDIGRENRDGIIGVWEAVQATSINIHGLLANLDRVIPAAAAMAAVTRQALSELPDLRTKNPQLRPIAERVRLRLLELERKGQDAKKWLAKLDRFAVWEAPALKRLSAMEQCFSHGDFGVNNVLFPSEGPPVVIDWESASLAPVGACLSKLACRDAEKQSKAAEIFSACLAAKGMVTSREEVLFGMRAVEVFRSLWSGARGRNDISERRLRWGLNHWPYLRFRN